MRHIRSFNEELGPMAAARGLSHFKTFSNPRASGPVREPSQDRE